MTSDGNPTIVLGGGLAGLAAALALTRAGRRVVVLERHPGVGGLARTVARGGFRFDLGGHRFYTADARIDAFLGALMAGELVTVPRRSRILLGGRYIDYPLRPVSAVAGLGLRATVRILRDYALECVKARTRRAPAISLEEWVVSQFGRALFDIYFKGYSEKIWGIGCERISAEWVAQRIQGLSLGGALRRALLGGADGRLPTLADRFLYPPLGIGRIAERMRERIERENAVVTGSRVERVEHSGSRLERVTAAGAGGRRIVEGDEFVSTVPLPSLVRMLSPPPPAHVLAAAAELRYRGLVVVGVMLERERVTDETWIYLPEPDVPFSRIHEPTNWSRAMAPPGKTLLVAEHFCSEGDRTWRAADAELVEATVTHLTRLGFISPREVIDGAVERVPKAYPLFDVGYGPRARAIADYLERFGNLHLAGRSGMFRYMNMDHAMAAGLDAAERILAARRAAPREAGAELAVAGAGG